MLRGALQTTLCSKFGIDTDAINLIDDVVLVRDQKDYHLGVHTDLPEKVLSLLLYLPVDTAALDAGTSLYEPLEVGRTCLGGPHYNPDEFREVKRIPYKPNTAFIFPKSDKSFHGVNKFNGPGTRDLLLYNVYWNNLRNPRTTKI